MKILRLPDVRAKTGLGHTSIYGKMASGTFPRPIRLTQKAMGWPEHEVDRWIEQQIALRDGDKVA